jgi:hypothetical protein
MPTDSIADALELLDFSAASHERPAFAGYSSTLLALARLLVRLCCVFERTVYAQQLAAANTSHVVGTKLLSSLRC